LADRADSGRVSRSPSAPEAPALLDGAVLATLHDEFASTGDLDELERLIRGFLDRGVGQIADMTAAAERGDADAIRDGAHKLKGSSRTLGATRAGAVAAAIEEAAAAGDVPAATRALPELEEVLALTRSAFAEAVASG
jgi:HPt (histidine-containing phosphotransfer) domain-containing protein